MNKMENEKTEIIKENGKRFKVTKTSGKIYYGDGFTRVQFKDDDSFSISAYKNPVERELCEGFLTTRNMKFDYDCSIHSNHVQYCYKNGEYTMHNLMVTGCSMAGVGYKHDTYPIDSETLKEYEPVIVMAEKIVGKTLINREKPVEVPKKSLVDKLKFW